MLFLSMVFLVSACGQSEDLPTAIVLPTSPPTDEVEEVQSVEEPTATATPIVAPTLPPTWTFTPDYSPTPLPTNTEIPPTETPLPAPDTVSPACDDFAADATLSTREFVIGEAPTAAWTSVEGAVLYRVFLYTFSSKVMRDDIYTDQTSWTFNPDEFELGENYIWAVWPLDAIGDQMCFERGLEMLPQRQPIGSGG